jgi:hypothetical protein
VLQDVFYNALGPCPTPKTVSKHRDIRDIVILSMSIFPPSHCGAAFWGVPSPLGLKTITTKMLYIFGY